MINFIKMMALLVIAILANIIKGIGKIFNNVGTVINPETYIWAKKKNK